MKKKIERYGLEKELLKDKNQFHTVLKNAKFQIEELMMSDVSSLKLFLQKKTLKNPEKKKKISSKTKKARHRSKSTTSYILPPLESNGRKEILENKKNINKLMFYLAKNKNVSLWGFWKDLNELLEGDVEKDNFFKLKEINLKYFGIEENVTPLFFIFIFILFLFFCFYFYIYFYFLFIFYLYFLFIFIFYFYFLFLFLFLFLFFIFFN